MKNYLERLLTESISSEFLDEDDVGIEVATPFIFKDDVEEEEVDRPNTEPFEEAFLKINEALDSLNEISYKDFKMDDSQSTKGKLNNQIVEINRALIHCEKLINHASKLKTEIGADQTIFFKDTFRKFTKIGERMNRLQNKIREFSK